MFASETISEPSSIYHPSSIPTHLGDEIVYQGAKVGAVAGERDGLELLGAPRGVDTGQ